jgi:hypothetical protein
MSLSAGSRLCPYEILGPDYLVIESSSRAKAPRTRHIIPVESSFTFVSAHPDSARGYLLFAREHTLMRELSLPAAALGAVLEIVDFSANGTTLAYSNIALFPDGKRRVVSIANRANVNRDL